jgi:uncharacterized protein (DUF433 family)
MYDVGDDCPDDTLPEGIGPGRVAPGVWGQPTAAFDRITCIPTILNGQPTIRGMRLTVRRVIEALAIYSHWDDLRREYPKPEVEDIRQALEFAARDLNEIVQPLEVL